MYGWAKRVNMPTNAPAHKTDRWERGLSEGLAGVSQPRGREAPTGARPGGRSLLLLQIIHNRTAFSLLVVHLMSSQ